MRAAIYERVSTTRQVNHGYSLDAQRDRLRSYCQARGYELVGEYIDGGVTGRTSDRDALDRLLSDARSGLFHVVVVVHLDRFFRSARQYHNTLHALDRTGILLGSLEGVDSRTAEGRLVLSVMASVAEMESQRIGERTHNARVAKARSGRANPSPNIKYGYDYDRQGQCYVKNATEADVLLRIFTLYAQGVVPRAIAATLNAEGVPTKTGRGKGWHREHISEMLKDTVYIGRGYANRFLWIPHADNPKKGRLVERPRSEWVDVTYPTIIPQDLWTAAQQRRETNKVQRAVQRAKPDYLLAGLVYCAECGLRFEVRTTMSRGRTYRYYRDRGMHEYPHLHHCRAKKLIRASVLEGAVWNELVDAMYDTDRLGDLIERQYGVEAERTASARAALDEAERKLAELAIRRQRLLTVYSMVDSAVTEADLNTQLKLITEQAERWQAQADRERDALGAGTLDVASITEAAAKAVSRQLGAMEEERDERGLVETFVERVEVTGSGDVKIRFTVGDVRISVGQLRTSELLGTPC